VPGATPTPIAAVSDLPLPTPEARAHSARVTARIRDEIVRAGGWIDFARYMDLALHAPGLGYYAAGATKLGAAGDFTTAPEMTPLFARAIATQVAAILAATTAREVVELGAGSGRLAADLLNALAERDALPSRYAILEPSPDLRARQQVVLAREAAAHLPRVQWVDALPAAIDGVVVANEVLDAIPVHLIGRRAGLWFERGVTWRDGADAVADDEPPGVPAGLAWADRECDPRLVALAQARFPPVDDYLSEVNPAAEALVEAIGRRLAGGAVLMVDYGFPQAEYYHPQRAAGTLMGHYRHRAHADPFLWPGLSDLTAHVDFSAIAAAGERGGLAVAGFTSQAAFLLGCGILDALAGVGPPESKAYLQAAAPVQKLLSPAEMGELFKVLALAKSAGIEWPGFALGDRSHRL
jgi:SAM-dependent MidA family methyltransferase